MMRGDQQCPSKHRIPPLTAASALIALAIFMGPAAAHGAYHLITNKDIPAKSVTGAFVTVCIDPAAGKKVLSSSFAGRKWATGIERKPRQAVEQLPFSGTPILVTSECLEDVLGAFQSMYPDRDIIAVEAAP